MDHLFYNSRMPTKDAKDANNFCALLVQMLINSLVFVLNFA